MSVEAELTKRVRQAWEQSPPPRRLAGLPEPGDVVVLERLGRFTVEWAVLEEGGSGRLLIVAADGMPLVGSADVEVRGPLVLRCRFGGWVGAGTFAGALRTATLAREDVGRALVRRTEVERGAVRGSVSACEVDDDLEYRDWMREAVEPAWLELSAAAEKAGIRPRSRSGIRRRGVRPLALAATLLLALGAGFLWRQHQELRDLRAEGRLAAERHREELDELRETLAARHRQELEAAGEDEAAAERRIEDLRRELDAARDRSVVRDFVAVSLEARHGRRGEEKPILVPPHASHVVFFMALGKATAGERLRAELVEPGTGRILLRLEDLHGDRELRIGLPAELLPPGRYLLRILGGEEPIAEAAFHVQRE